MILDLNFQSTPLLSVKNDSDEIKSAIAEKQRKWFLAT